MHCPTSQQSLKLYKDLLRYSQQLKLTDRDYFSKRIKTEFRKNLTLKDKSEITFNFERINFINEEISSLDMIRSYVLKFPAIIYNSTCLKHTVDYSGLPKLIESELQEQHVRGSGPGGQATNKTANCVVLKHIPTGLVVKNHETRSLDQNRKKARAQLITKLDNLINGNNSVEAQLKRMQERKSMASHKKREKLQALKAEWKSRENFD